MRKRISEEKMKDHEHRGLYPPRFQVFFVSSPADPTLQGGKIKFKGAESDLVYDIYLNPPATPLASTTTSTTMTHLAATSKIKLWELLYVEFIKKCYYSTTTCPCKKPVARYVQRTSHMYRNEDVTLEIEDLQEVRSQLMEVEVKWLNIGLELGITYPELEKIKTNNSNDVTNCLTAMLIDWLKGSYDTSRYGEPSWQKLSEAVSKKAGGDNPRVANRILQQHSGTESQL